MKPLETSVTDYLDELKPRSAGKDLEAIIAADASVRHGRVVEVIDLIKLEGIVKFAINTEAGRKKGLKDGELIWVETETGRKVRGRVKLTQGIHPEGLGIGACARHWGDGMPVAKGKGVFFNELLELDWNHVSPVNFNLDLCARVKVTPVRVPQ